MSCRISTKIKKIFGVPTTPERNNQALSANPITQTKPKPTMKNKNKTVKVPVSISFTRPITKPKPTMKKKNKNKIVKVSVYVSPSLLERIDSFAKADNRNRSNAIKHLLMTHLNIQ